MYRENFLNRGERPCFANTLKIILNLHDTIKIPRSFGIRENQSP